MGYVRGEKGMAMRLIDADALPKYTGLALSAAEVAKAVELAPTIDAVPVVWCGECEFFKPDRETPASISWYGRCQKNNRQWKMAVTDYCSNGWRKDDDKR